jgi:signal transduction histidine kinase
MPPANGAREQFTSAAKYTSEGGRIWLTVTREKSEAIISVRYTGGGISQPLLAQIFDLFVQVNRSLDRSQGGLGLGLTIVKRIVEMHGGRIETRNKGIGKGSECLVWLPLLEQVCAA